MSTNANEIARVNQITLRQLQQQLDTIGKNDSRYKDLNDHVAATRKVGVTIAPFLIAPLNAPAACAAAVVSAILNHKIVKAKGEKDNQIDADTASLKRQASMYAAKQALDVIDTQVRLGGGV